jgi:N-acyl-D-aspartate/D-glutamate deacylase
MSGLTAARLKLFDRGLLRPGMKADLAIFEAQVIGDRATFEKPHQYAEGVRHVIVNGQAVLRDGKMTAARPGAVLYGPAKQ